MFNDILEKVSSSRKSVFLAPMAGITDAPFRELVCSFGATAVVSEMISSEALIRNNQKTHKRLHHQISDFPKIVQIVGANPKNMAESAIINESCGADIIDINMGCPARKIVGNNSGSALMKDEKLALSIVESVVNAVKIPITLKMRLGWDNEHINFLQLSKKFENAGIQMLAIHGRTRNQMYTGSADWNVLNQLKNIVKIPYLCNGDIKTPEDAKEALKRSDANGVMIGRASLGNPWLLKQVIDFFDDKPHTQPHLNEQFEIIMKHFDRTIDFYGKNRGIKVFRKHFCWYSGGLSKSSKFRENINQLDDILSIRNYVEDFYKKQLFFLEENSDIAGNIVDADKR